MEKTKKKAIVAMSGGVDSSIAALFLLEQSFEVEGVFLRTWRMNQENGKLTDIESSAIESAQKVAQTYHFPLHVIDVRDQFRKKVIKYFIESYSNGRTANPCVHCNRVIKWAVLLEQADNLDIEFVATGHYARTNRMPNGMMQLIQARDSSKDQTYFLSNLTKAQLNITLFPNGDYLKSEIRAYARQKGLSVADRSDSQDLCFLEDELYSDFLRRYAPDRFKSGQIVSVDGTPLGEHQGIGFYTIGQRKGLGISSKRPLYVIAKDIEANHIIVGPEEDLGREELIVKNMHWIIGDLPSEPTRLQVKIRYRTEKKWANVIPLNNNQFKLLFEKKLRDITPGQYAVFYDNQIVLGSGEIE